ncbi:hypothetical protein [Ascidiaceihabitans sp.]|uniref:hypothetical protein n=1 Tax=Ascidiaceihabitans sp. TaxID=1872644 RepID=UPI00329821BD
MREKGKGFFSTATKMTYGLTTTQSGYFEYGITDRLTFGASIDVNLEGGYATSGMGHLFVRKPLKWKLGKGLWAYQLGLGTRIDALGKHPYTKTSLHFGKGITWRDKGGWVSVDAEIEWALGSANNVMKVDMTVGLNISPRSKAMLQVYTNVTQYEARITLAPSYIFTPKAKKISYVIGLEAPTSSRNDFGIKLGVWQKF